MWLLPKPDDVVVIAPRRRGRDIQVTAGEPGEGAKIDCSRGRRCDRAVGDAQGRTAEALRVARAAYYGEITRQSQGGTAADNVAGGGACLSKVQREGAALNARRAGVRVGAGQGERVGAQLDQADAGIGDVR